MALALNKTTARAVAGSTRFQRIIPEIFMTEQYWPASRECTAA